MTHELSKPSESTPYLPQEPKPGPTQNEGFLTPNDRDESRRHQEPREGQATRIEKRFSEYGGF